MPKYSNQALVVFYALLTGFFGDALLQGGVKIGMGPWGLKTYFQQHGRSESLFIAGGMMGLFYLAYVVTGLPLKVQWLAIYGIILDVIFRFTRLFPSLDSYYKSLNYVESGLWGAIPMIIPLLILKAVRKDAKIV